MRDSSTISGMLVLVGSSGSSSVTRPYRPERRTELIFSANITRPPWLNARLPRMVLAMPRATPVTTLLATLLLMAGTWNGHILAFEPVEPTGVGVNGSSLSETTAGEPAGVLIEIHEGDFLPREWPGMLTSPVESYRELALGFFRIPWRYVGTGVRADRTSPFWVRAATRVELPEGEHRLLLRSRSAARLWEGGRVVAQLDFPTAIQDGHDPVRNDALQLGPTRWVAAGDQETLVPFQSDGRPREFILEFMVGGRKGSEPLRTELGETIVAVAPADRDDFQLLSPKTTVPLTDADWESYRAEREEFYQRLEAQRRREAFARQKDYWKLRHELAAAFAASHPVLVPEPSRELPARNEIDHFLNRDIAQALKHHTELAEKPAAPVAEENEGRPTPSVTFHRDIQPIFERHCSACHGNRPQGGLSLDSLEAARAGGDSGLPAIVPGDPEASELFQRITSQDADLAMPLDGNRLTDEELEKVRHWIASGARWPAVAPRKLADLPGLTSDFEFLRRVSLDVRGTIPTLEEMDEFLADSSEEKRSRWIDRFLEDPQRGDGWMPYWLDVLAENPNLINPTLNSTGPFRWWLYDALRDNKPWDVVVTELILMEGSERGGGPAGFGLAALNDAPHAAKAGILSSALLAVDMRCARCHDAPHHSTLQSDLFHLAAMLARAPVEVPPTSSVAVDDLPTNRPPRIRVTLEPGVPVEPQWPLNDLAAPEPDVPLLKEHEEDSRGQLAALITQPTNERFAEVLVNRVWRRFLGRGLMEPVDDWEQGKLSHPELLRWLARDFVAHGYDLRRLDRQILNSHAYQRQASDDVDANAQFASPVKRRLGPEQLVDVLHDAAGVPYDSEPLCLDLDSGRPQRLATHLGQPTRAWYFGYLANDRDRPSLNLPRAQVITELLTAFGWNGDRQEPVSDRMVEPSVLQAALLAHGATTRRLVRLTSESPWTDRAISADSPEELVTSAFRQFLTRDPSDDEMAVCCQLLAPGFSTRVSSQATSKGERSASETPRPTQPYVTWANHLVEEANRIRLREEEQVRLGPPPTERLRADWRERMEDFLWALINSPEMAYIP